MARFPVVDITLDPPYAMMFDPLVIHQGRAYLAGPMRGYELYNFPAFHKASAYLRSIGWEIISPAEMDLELGLDPAADLPEWFTTEGAMQRDLHEITHPLTTAIILLPGWVRSTGALHEVRTAMAVGLDVYLYDPLLHDEGDVELLSHNLHDVSHEYIELIIEASQISDDPTILQEANSLIFGDRNNDYGHPLDDFTRTGRMWAAILGVPTVTPDQVGLCMVALKVSRQCNKPKRDNLVDIAGYSGTVDMLINERIRREEG